MTSTMGADVTGMMEKDLYMVICSLSELSLQMSGDTISTHSSPWYGMIPSSGECFENLGGILQ